MANYNCGACDDLRNDAPNFVVNGLTTTEIASLKNNTGLNPSNSNDDCEDLNNMNDCLIGNMEDEIEVYDVCDWKEYTKNLVGNVRMMFGGVIAAICGLWTRLISVEKKSETFCDLIEQMIAPRIPTWGILPLATSAEAIARRCGTATNKVEAQPGGGDAPAELKPSQNIGLYYTKQTITSCSNGRKEVIEWIAPHTYLYDLKAGAVSGDILWKISKSEAQTKLGISDHLWQQFTISSWTWTETRLEDRQMAWLKLTVGENGLSANEMGIIFRGCTAPNDPIASDSDMSAIGADRCKVYRHYA